MASILRGILSVEVEGTCPLRAAIISAAHTSSLLSDLL